MPPNHLSDVTGPNAAESPLRYDRAKCQRLPSQACQAKIPPNPISGKTGPNAAVALVRNVRINAAHESDSKKNGDKRTTTKDRWI